MKAKDIKIQYPEDTSKMEIVLLLDKNLAVVQKVEKLKKVTAEGKILAVDIKQHRKKRSLDANSYCWILAQAIAEKIGNTKEFVYKQAIKDVGQFEIVPIRNDVLERWIRNWQAKGLGWQSGSIGDSTQEGFTNTINYYGSSVYDSKEMYLLIEELVYQAEELGIDTMTPRERQGLIEKWENRGN
ncbi:MAG TPA: hypothetical protein VFC79_02195 [Tissierellaceae bacterium]|nr:hypothetical protein [Tissierellaceae bacterium]